MRVNFNNVKQLKSGHTIWRCMAHGNGIVSIHEFILKGRKVAKVYRSHLDNRALSITYKIEPKDYKTGGNYLNDIHGHGSERIAAFTSRHEALKWQQDVQSGRNWGPVLNAIH